MKNIDYNVLEKVMKVYQGMPNNQKMVMEASAAEAWQSAFREYTRLCTHDEELVRMQYEIHKIENALFCLTQASRKKAHFQFCV